jgi:hypothetical protein
VTPLVAEVLIGVVTFVVSVSVSAFLAGMRLGQMESDMKGLIKDIAEIRGMFILKLRE